MEFFRTAKVGDLNSDQLKDLLTIANLPKYCESIDTVMFNEGHKGVIYCIWGQFDVNREVIKHGIRFSLPGCPNALAWTISKDKEVENIVIHCAINKTEHDEVFIETIDQFMDDWAEGLSKL